MPSSQSSRHFKPVCRKLAVCRNSPRVELGSGALYLLTESLVAENRTCLAGPKIIPGKIVATPGRKGGRVVLKMVKEIINDTKSCGIKTPDWQGASPKQFLVAIIRLPALWLFVYGLYGATYLPGLVPTLRGLDSGSVSYHYAKFDLSLAVLRVLIHIGAGTLVIQFGAPRLNRLLADSEKEVAAAEDLKS